MKTRYTLVASALTLAVLSACSDPETEFQEGTFNPALSEPTPSRIQFNPLTGVLPVPNDLLFSGTEDGTLQMPGETAAIAAGQPVDLGDPSVALGALDGWSTQMPKQISVDLPDGATIDATTVNNESVYLVEAMMGGDTGCESVPRGVACAPVSTLSYGVDYIATSSGNDITIVPLKPLKPATTYLVGVNGNVKDSRGIAVRGSEIYEETAQTDFTITHASIGPLQGLLNSYEAVINAAPGTSDADIIYSAAWTTSSVGLALNASIQIAQLQGVNISGTTNTGVTVEQALISSNTLPAEALGTTAFSRVSLYSGQITLPYYLSNTEPKSQQWQALCDSPVMIAALSAEDIAALTPGANAGICQSISPQLFDFGLDSARYITKFNFVPQMRSLETVNVQITTPIDAPKPWPIVILQHGITSQKEDMLLVTGALSQAGFATMAIDHPLHGERGFTFGDDPQTMVVVNASTNSATDYLNLEHLLVARDNMNQTAADLLALRLALNLGVSGDLAQSDFDLTNVQFAGMSLGSITGIDFVTTANANGLTVKQAAFISPGGAVAPFLIESQQFGGLVQASILEGAGSDLTNEYLTFEMSGDSTCLALATDREAYRSCMYQVFVGQQQAEQDTAALTEINTLVSSFALAAQTVLDSADPNNFAASLGAQGIPIYMTAIVGDGINNLPDQVIPNQTTSVPVGGTEPLARYMGISAIDSDTIGATAGLVRFTEGGHSSLLNPADSQATTTEMQTQLATFHAAGVISVTNTAVVAPASNM